MCCGRGVILGILGMGGKGLRWLVEIRIFFGSRYLKISKDPNIAIKLDPNFVELLFDSYKAIQLGIFIYK